MTIHFLAQQQSSAAAVRCPLERFVQVSRFAAGIKLTFLNYNRHQ